MTKAQQCRTLDAVTEEINHGLLTPHFTSALALDAADVAKRH
jgi:hypothetical protein